MIDMPLTRAQAFEESENTGRNPTDNPTIGDVIAARFHRRDLLKGALGAAAIAATVSPSPLQPPGGRMPRTAPATASRSSPPASMTGIMSPRAMTPTSWSAGAIRYCPERRPSIR